jgi:peptidoglycan/xylan/chitin deacetylase (PgdA/CDA1 family)
MPPAPTKANVVMRVQTNKPFVAITIDDFFTFSNYEQQEGIRLLEAANALHAPLTVCPTGYALEAYKMAAPEQLARLRELVTQGRHEVCNHTLSHPFLSQLERDAQLDEIRAGNDLIAQHLEHPVSPYLRPPFGDYNDDTRLAAAEAGLPTIVTWTIDSGDWVDPPPSVDTIVAQTAHAQPGDILLMHANRAVSAEALPRIIEHLRARGLEPVTLSTVLASGTPVLVDEQTDR